MAEIPLPPRSHHKAKKLTDEEQEKRNKRLERSFLALNEGLGNKEKGKCYYREVSRDLQKKCQEIIYPVCPAIREWMGEEENRRLFEGSFDG